MLAIQHNSPTSVMLPASDALSEYNGLISEKYVAQFIKENPDKKDLRISLPGHKHQDRPINIPLYTLPFQTATLTPPRTPLQ